nr:endonuclease [Roseibium limicola]
MTYGIIAVVYIILAFGGIFMLDHWFSQRVGDRPFSINGRKIETDDPFVQKQFRKFHFFKVIYSMSLIALLLVTVSYV